MNVKPADLLPLVVIDAGDKTRSRLDIHAAALKPLARVDSVEFADTAPKGSVQIVAGEATFCLPLAGVVDVGEERNRLSGELKKLEGEIKRLEGKLGNEKFVANAPEAVVAEERDKLSGYQDQKAKTEQALGRLAELG